MSTEDGDGLPECNNKAGRSLGGCLRKKFPFQWNNGMIGHSAQMRTIWVSKKLMGAM